MKEYVTIKEEYASTSQNQGIDGTTTYATEVMEGGEFEKYKELLERWDV